MKVFEIYRSDKEWFFRLKSNDGKVLFSSEGYSSKRAALESIARLNTSKKKASDDNMPLRIAEDYVNTYSEDFHNLANR